VLESDVADHASAALPRGQLCQQVVTAVHRTDAGRAEDFMPGEDVEVGAERGHVDGQVRNRLRPVDHDSNAARLGHRDHRVDRQDSTEGVGDVAERDDLRPIGQQRCVGVQLHLTGVVNRHRAQTRSHGLGEQLPRDDVGVVLERGEHDLVAGADPRPAKGVGQQVDALGGAADEDDLLRARRSQQPGDRRPRVLVRVGRARRKSVRAAMDVAVVPFIEAGHGIEHYAWLLRRGRVVEPHEPMAVNPLVQGGEVCAGGSEVAGRRPFGHEARQDGPARARRVEEVVRR
jgi:hypothetical protein